MNCCYGKWNTCVKRKLGAKNTNAVITPGINYVKYILITTKLRVESVLIGLQ
jgi:hypothetical protein